MKKVGIILPCYNEEKGAKENILKIQEYCKSLTDYSFCYIPVNDGSKDNTKEVLESIEGVDVVTYDDNQGKGNAVTEGLKKAVALECDCITFMDIDLSTDLEALPKLLKELEETDFVIGSRYEKESNIVIKQPFKRRFISKISRIIIKIMFHFPTKDTQCGFKGMNKECASIIMEKSLVKNFAFDVEYLYIAKLHKKTMKPLPVIWKDDRDSRVQAFKSSVKFFFDLFKIKRNKKKYVN